MRSLLILSFIMSFLFNPLQVMGKETISISFINPGISNPMGQSGGFWVDVSEFMEAVAEDLDIELEIIYAERSHVQMLDSVKEILARDQYPDYIITGNEKLVAGEILKLTQDSGIQVFLFNNGFIDEQASEYGSPRERYPHWIGAFIPDQHDAGYQEAIKIIEAAAQVGKNSINSKLYMFGINGDHVTHSSIERTQGLYQAVSENSDVVLKQVTYGYWEQDKSLFITKGLLRRYPETSIIWAANDPMAFGAIEGAESLGRKPGKDIFIGGVNWSNQAIQNVRDGKMVTTIGGHFMDGGWSLVLIYDLHHNHDFGAETIIQPMTPITSKNASNYLKHFANKDWRQIDFSRFPKAHNPGQKQYDFTLEALLQQLESE